MPIRNSNSRRKCKPIAINKKEKLVNLVIDKEKSVHKASKILGIKYSTAKAIVKRFKQTGILSARVKAPEEPTLTIKEQEVEESVPSIQVPSPYQKQQEFQYFPYYPNYPLASQQYGSWTPYCPYPYASNCMTYPSYGSPFWTD